MQREQEISSERGAVEVKGYSQRKKNTTFSICTALTFFTLFFIIASLYFQTGDLLKRINLVEGPIAKILPIYSGELHYSRIPHQYWKHRIQMVKAMGFNSISIYVMWNYHQIRKGVFDFQTKDRNLKEFLTMCQEQDMYVLMRPGPYVCAQWDFGGLPVRLLANDTMKIRTHDAGYEAEVNIYFTALAEIIKPFLAKNGGNIVLLQIQNQLGSFNTDNHHTIALKDMWEKLQVFCEYYIEDAPWSWQKHYWPKAHIGLSQGGTVKEFADIDISSKRSNGSLVFGGEIYTGWLTHWGQHINGRDLQLFKDHFRNLVMANRSVSLYVAHGGTNFGLTAGANGFPNNDYMPHITSYDYDAPINQAGEATAKFHAIRQIMKTLTNKNLPQIPSQNPSIKIEPFSMSQIHSYFFSNLPNPQLVQSDLTYFQSDALKMYEQGFVVYQTILKGRELYHFNLTVRDFAIVYLNDMFETTISRQKIAFQNLSVQCANEECKLTILVEAMGHINYGIKQTTDKKGLIEFTRINIDTQEVINNQFKWNITGVPINDSFFFWKLQEKPKMQYPLIRKAQLQLTLVGDTFLDMTFFRKGYVWVNGHLLGRYWEKGPQKRLFCPGVWLKFGINEIHVLQMLDYSQKSYIVSGQERAFDIGKK